MEQVTIAAVRRTEAGKGPARKCRREGQIPGVVYGLGNDTINLSVPRQDLDRALKVGHGANVLIDLVIDGAAVAEEQAAIVKKIERHPITRAPFCVDFQWVSLKETITVDVNVVLKGRAPGQELGGILEHITHAIHVRCLPVNIPDEFVVDVSALNIGDAVHLRDLAVNPTIEITNDPETVIVVCAAPAKAKSERTEAEAAEAAAAEEGEAKEAKEAG
jgi:large subunit ribosomal protein L25